MQDAVTTPQWEEENSQDFIDYGKYFVPDREIQINCICEVIPPPSESAYILDLCCGEGLLTRALLEKFPESHVYGLDGSLKMIAHIEKTLVAYGERFKARQFDLAASDWRDFSAISTLTMHHFLPERKVTIYRKVREALRTSGIYIEGDQATTVEEEKSILYWDGLRSSQVVTVLNGITTSHYRRRPKPAFFRSRDSLRYNLRGATRHKVLSMLPNIEVLDTT